MRISLDALRKDPERAGDILRELRTENEDLYMLEELLEKEDELLAKAVDQ